MRAALLTNAIRTPLTGIGRYTLELAKQFVALQAGVQFVGGADPLLWSEVAEKGRGSRARFISQLKQIVKSSSILSLSYPYLRALREWYFLRSYKDYVVHSPNFYLPSSRSCRRIVTIHDLSMFLFPECFESAESAFLQSICKNSLKEADQIITVSRTVKREICNYFSYNPEKIAVTPLACSQFYKPRERVECQNVLTKYGLIANQYSLFVGTIEPRKNISTLIYAYKRLPDKLRKQYPLVIVGHHGWRSELEHRLLHKAREEGWLHYLDYVNNHELYYLYSGCRLFCFPTLYEGFGLPVLEAMSSGIAVLCSDLPVLREVCGDAACYCRVKDIDLWGVSLEKCLLDDGLRSQMIEKGLQRSSTFSWRACALQTIGVYGKFI